MSGLDRKFAKRKRGASKNKSLSKARNQRGKHPSQGLLNKVKKQPRKKTIVKRGKRKSKLKSILLNANERGNWVNIDEEDEQGANDEFAKPKKRRTRRKAKKSVDWASPLVEYCMTKEEKKQYDRQKRDQKLRASYYIQCLIDKDQLGEGLVSPQPSEDDEEQDLLSSSTDSSSDNNDSEEQQFEFKQRLSQRVQSKNARDFSQRKNTLDSASGSPAEEGPTPPLFTQTDCDLRLADSSGSSSSSFSPSPSASSSPYSSDSLVLLSSSEESNNTGPTVMIPNRERPITSRPFRHRRRGAVDLDRTRRNDLCVDMGGDSNHDHNDKNDSLRSTVTGLTSRKRSKSSMVAEQHTNDDDDNTGYLTRNDHSNNVVNDGHPRKPASKRRKKSSMMQQSWMDVDMKQDSDKEEDLERSIHRVCDELEKLIPSNSMVNGNDDEESGSVRWDPRQLYEPVITSIIASTWMIFVERRGHDPSNLDRDEIKELAQKKFEEVKQGLLLTNSRPLSEVLSRGLEKENVARRLRLSTEMNRLTLELVCRLKTQLSNSLRKHREMDAQIEELQRQNRELEENLQLERKRHEEELPRYVSKATEELRNKIDELSSLSSSSSSNNSNLNEKNNESNDVVNEGELTTNEEEVNTAEEEYPEDPPEVQIIGESLSQLRPISQPSLSQRSIPLYQDSYDELMDYVESHERMQSNVTDDSTVETRDITVVQSQEIVDQSQQQKEQEQEQQQQQQYQHHQQQQQERQDGEESMQNTDQTLGKNNLSDDDESDDDDCVIVDKYAGMPDLTQGMDDDEDDDNDNKSNQTTDISLKNRDSRVDSNAALIPSSLQHPCSSEMSAIVSGDVTRESSSLFDSKAGVPAMESSPGSESDSSVAELTEASESSPKQPSDNGICRPLTNKSLFRDSLASNTVSPERSSMPDSVFSVFNFRSDSSNGRSPSPFMFPFMMNETAKQKSKQQPSVFSRMRRRSAKKESSPGLAFLTSEMVGRMTEDWICQECDTLNPCEQNACDGCGSSRAEN